MVELNKIIAIVIENCNFIVDTTNIFTNINFTFTKHTILIGANGIGKTMLLLLIMKKFPHYQGSIRINQLELKTISDQY